MDSDFKKFKKNISLLEKTIKNDTVNALKLDNYDSIIQPNESIHMDKIDEEI